MFFQGQTGSKFNELKGFNETQTLITPTAGTPAPTSVPMTGMAPSNSLFGATSGATSTLGGITQNTSMGGSNSAIAAGNSDTAKAPVQSSLSSSFGGFYQQSTLSNLPVYSWGAPFQKVVSRFLPLQIQTPADTLAADRSKYGESQSEILGRSSILGLDQFPSIVDQLQKIKNAWDPTHSDCAFQYYFYNRVPIDQVALYVKPLHHNQQKWDEAIANRPENSVVPALAVGFSDIQKRVQLQEQQVTAYRVRMHEIINKLKELSQKHDLSTTVKISDATLRHLELSRRSLALAAKVQILKGRGYALQPEEENLKQRLIELSKSLNDPGVFGKVNELWARMTFVREKAKSIEEARQGKIIMSINWKRDKEQLDRITKVLTDQYAGISYVINILKNDLNEVDKALQKIQEHKKLLEQPKSRGSRKFS
ncbi:hypothetical protein T552_01959 [Pneumocystis carinii B80]|uniref:Nucleoporin Nup54 alpha-helical domain-containing protein n=1 Tax=Pneumocystis carinii (strain B80) TaxID=1408658 RepID=A0A0W4ZIA2_PNEC8|nr:hypothetical protein T552_01959 [Pneumocystis carinii B80]KTW28098.1 hypothetical protein T552_01959 [Pneumocystis carinii B80]